MTKKIINDIEMKLITDPKNIRATDSFSREAELLALLKEADVELKEHGQHLVAAESYMSNPDQIKIYRKKIARVVEIRSKIAKFN